jgi:hypothetical protein
VSLTEILDAVKRLSRAEKVQVMHLLVDELGGLPPADDGVPDELRRLLPAPGTPVHTGWQATTDEAGMRAILEALADAKATG